MAWSHTSRRTAHASPNALSDSMATPNYGCPLTLPNLHVHSVGCGLVARESEVGTHTATRLRFGMTPKALLRQKPSRWTGKALIHSPTRRKLQLHLRVPRPNTRRALVGNVQTINRLSGYAGANPIISRGLGTQTHTDRFDPGYQSVASQISVCSIHSLVLRAVNWCSLTADAWPLSESLLCIRDAREETNTAVAPAIHGTKK